MMVRIMNDGRKAKQQKLAEQRETRTAAAAAGYDTSDDGDDGEHLSDRDHMNLVASTCSTVNAIAREAQCSRTHVRHTMMAAADAIRKKIGSLLLQLQRKVEDNI